MSDPKLINRLNELHEELSSINDGLDKHEHVDGETIDALQQLVADAGRLIEAGQSESEETEEADDNHGLMDRIVEFDREHPRVTWFLNQISDMLGMMGI